MSKMRVVELCIALLASGCNFVLGGVEVEHVDSSVQKPSNIAIYLSASDSGEPLTELDESNFVVYENEQEIPKEQAKLTILERDVAVAHHVLLLVDLSGKLDDSERKDLTGAIENFVQVVRATQGVTVYGFDGGERIYLLGEFSKNKDAEKASLEGKIKQRDPSRNLNGSIAKALDALDARLMRVKRPVRVGSLVVFTRGPDVAGRVAPEALDETLEKSRHDRFSIGFESEDTYYLEQLGDDGVVLAKNMSGLGDAFQQAALKVDKAFYRHYLIQYCSPARAGVRQLRLEVHYVNKEGEERTGDLAVEFDAEGFGPGCDPGSTPRFVVHASQPGELDAEEPPSDEAPSGEATGPAAPKADATPAASDDEDVSADDDEEETFVPPPDKPGYE